MTDNDPPSKEARSSTEMRDIATAFHEAGHAVMALSLGRSIQKVTILPAQLNAGGRRLGACQIKKGANKTPHDLLEQEVMILLAGMVAESHFTQQYCQRSAAQDLATARRMLATRAKSDRQLERLERRWLEKTEHVLSSSDIATAIKDIATELLKQKTISGRAARHFYDQACRV